MFHHGMQVTDVEGDSTPGFDGNKEDAEKFISISSSEIARYQRLMYANGVKGSTRRLLIVLQGMDASGKGGIVRHVIPAFRIPGEAIDTTCASWRPWG